MLRILHCKRCGQDWACRIKDPRRCGKCKSPYWDREQAVPVAVEKQLAAVVDEYGLDPLPGLEELKRIAAGKIPEAGNLPGPDLEAMEICGHREWNEIEGAWFKCGLPKHLGRKHGKPIREEE